jgi:hypothetical protein
MNVVFEIPHKYISFTDVVIYTLRLIFEVSRVYVQCINLRSISLTPNRCLKLSAARI